MCKDSTAKNWHLELFSKSILKQAKLKNLIEGLGQESFDGEVNLDLGSDNGVISFKLRELGGEWHSADLTAEVVESIKGLVKENVYKLEGVRLPFSDQMFDRVVIVDMLEHVEDDRQLLSEISRVLKPEGQLLINAPNLKRFSFLRIVRNLIGQTDEKHGHLRPGYDRKGLEELSKDMYSFQKSWTYSGFFTELNDTKIVFFIGLLKSAPVRKLLATLKGEKEAKPSESTESPSRDESEISKGQVLTGEGMEKFEKQFKLYSALYPVFKFFSGLDRFLYPFEGYMRLSVLRKNP